MKICSISDIHGNLIEIPKCDVLCIAGDIVPVSIQRDYTNSEDWWYTDFCNWIKTLDCKKVIFTPGNHDFLIEQKFNNELLDEFRNKLSELTGDKVELLLDNSFTYENITFYGTPWIEPMVFQKWAFYDLNDKELPSHFESIPKCDILITHENPNYNEKLEYYSFGKYKHHFFGHWHDGISYGYLNQHNCSILTDHYIVRDRLKIVTVEI